MSKGGRYLNNGSQKSVNRSGNAGGKPRKRGGWKKVLLIILAVILLLVVIAGVGIVLYGKFLLSKRTKVETVRPTLPPVTQPIETQATEEATEPTETEPTAPTEPDYGKTGKVVNILIVGQSSRAGEEAKLADTIMLATINKMTSTLTVTSFLRDTYTQFPNPYTDVRGVTHSCGKNKINAAYALGWNWGGTADAMMFLDQTITNNFGIEIDGNVEVDFDAFETAVDLVNGIPMDLTQDEADYLNNFFKDMEDEEYRATFHEGDNHLDGWEALVYARMRHSSAADNDYKRTNRQRQVIAALLDKCTRRSIPELNRMAQELMPYLTTDLSDGEIATLMLELIPLLSNLQMESVQMPAEGTMWSVEIEMDGVTQYPLAFDVAKNTEIMRSIAEADHM